MAKKTKKPLSIKKQTVRKQGKLSDGDVDRVAGGIDFARSVPCKTK